MFKSASKINKLLTILGLGLGLMVLIACVSQSPEPTNNAEASGSQPAVSIGSPNVNSPNVQSVIGSFPPVQDGYATARTLVAGNGQTDGISVSGQGLVSGTPDLAILNLGVEAIRITVQLARDDAAAAMGQVIEVLKENGVADQDIRTRNFNINPRYDRDRRSITGYQVNNQLTVKIRDLDRISQIIDEVTVAGGDLTRFQSITFSIEDTKPLEEQARAAAVADLMAKANQLATLTGVNLGKPFSISETGGFSPLRVAFAETARLDLAMAAPTPIMAGEVDVVVTLQAIFAIQ